MNSIEKAFFNFCEKFNRLPSFSEVYEHEPVGRWRWRVNNLYHLKKLSPKILKKLEGLPFWEFSDDPWYNYYENLEYSLSSQIDINLEQNLWLEKQSELFQEFKLSDEKVNLFDNLGISWLQLPGNRKKLIHLWFQRLEQVNDFYDKYRKLPSHKDNGKSEFKVDLYSWLNRQRNFYRMKQLKKKQIQLLNEIEKDWHVNEINKSFASRITYLKDYYKKHNSYPDGNGWVVENRMRYRQGKLPEWKAEELEKLSEWEWTGREAKFFKTYEMVNDFMRKHKRAPKIGETYKGINIYSWIISAKSRYKEGGNYPNKEKAALLQNLPYFSWDKQSDEWNRNFKLLKQFLKKYKRFPIPKEVYQETVIGSWLGTQRARYKKGLMLDAEKENLQNLSDWSWSPLDDIWQQKYQNYLKEFESGLSDESIKWSRKQRSRYTKATLEKERIVLLEKLPSWTWSPHEVKWQNKYNELVKFIKDHDCFPSNKSILGSWIYRQIAEHKYISLERIEKLEQIPGWKWSLDGLLSKKK